jgi:hypothetical protein
MWYVLLYGDKNMCMGKRDPAKVSLENIVFHNEIARACNKAASEGLNKKQILEAIAGGRGLGCHKCMRDYVRAQLSGNKKNLTENSKYSHELCKSQVLDVIANQGEGYKTFQSMLEAGTDIGCESCVDTYNYAIALLDGDKSKIEELDIKYRRKEDASPNQLQDL